MDMAYGRKCSTFKTNVLLIVLLFTSMDTGWCMLFNLFKWEQCFLLT